MTDTGAGAERPAFDVAAYVDAASAALGIALHARSRDEVIANFARLHALFELIDDRAPAPAPADEGAHTR
jgi:hypothetical protein